MLVVSEVWLPGWEVVSPHCSGVSACPSRDAEQRPYFEPVRADLTLVGIWLPPESVEFVLRYRPFSVRLGLWISGGTLSALLGITLWHRRRHAQVALL